MRRSLKLIASVAMLGCWVGPGVPCNLAQSHPSPSELVQELQSNQTTDNARDELLKLGKSDPEVRQYLTVHLPPLIEIGPRMATCPGYPCQVWKNALAVAAGLKIGEAAPAIARWITVKGVNPSPGIHPYGNKLEINPAAIALSLMGDPAIPALRHVLNSGSPDERALAVGSLCTIQTPKAKAVLREDLPRESDPSVQAMIKRELEKNDPLIQCCCPSPKCHPA
jgi:hypothetical protein